MNNQNFLERLNSISTQLNNNTNLLNIDITTGNLYVTNKFHAANGNITCFIPVNILDTTDCGAIVGSSFVVNPNLGALLVAGGVNIKKNLYVGGNIYCNKTININGNLNINKNIYITEDSIISGNLVINDSLITSNICNANIITGNILFGYIGEVECNTISITNFMELHTKSIFYSNIINANLVQTTILNSDILKCNNGSFDQLYSNNFSANSIIYGKNINGSNILIQGNLLVSNISISGNIKSNLNIDGNLIVNGYIKNGYLIDDTILYNFYNQSNTILLSGNINFRKDNKLCEILINNILIANDVTSTGYIYANLGGYTNINKFIPNIIQNIGSLNTYDKEGLFNYVNGNSNNTSTIYTVSYPDYTINNYPHLKIKIYDGTNIMGNIMISRFNIVFFSNN